MTTIQQTPGREVIQSTAPQVVVAQLLPSYLVRLDARTFEDGGAWDESGKPNDADIIELVWRLLRHIDAPVLLDVGASTGSFSLLPHFLENAVCHAFEPVPCLFDILTSNLALNDLCARVFAHQRAVLDSARKVNIHVPHDRSDIGLSTLGPNLQRFTRGNEIPVQAVSLDDFCQMHRLSRIDVIKIDSEGCEKLVLEGGRESISQFRPQLILEFNETNMSQFKYDGEQLLEELRYLGYEFKLVGNEDMHCWPRWTMSVR